MVVFFLANGFEELEAIAPLDILRRGGVEVITAGIGGKVITGSHGISVACDKAAEVIFTSEIEGVILPGGMPGTRNLAASQTVEDALAYCARKGLLIGAICAAPSVLGEQGLLDGREATCFPGFEEKLTGAKLSSEYVVRDGNIITAKGAGVAAEFGFALLTALKDEETAETVRRAMQFR
ncbi:MAG: DJ-1/PfpI family protein [Ruminococcus sp.]|jgi:4-methyl-5(b-hydroxyethyl)-thiazole monophosphate biosynthesis|nr:DJ-1/PfpI family protein [Ruminococcus sp.]